MSENYFKCEPGRFCQDATCCRTVETQPCVSVGDFLRLSEYTDEPPEHIWKSRGDVSLSKHSDMKSGQFLVTLSLLHDPCPYLTDDSKCGIYAARPLGCASFPLVLYAEQNESRRQYEHYACLKGAEARPEQIGLWQQLRDILQTEAETEIAHFWRGKTIYIDASKTSDYFRFAGQAMDLQLKRDPKLKSYDPETRPDCCSKRSVKLMKAIKQAIQMSNSGELQNDVKTYDYIELLRPVMFAVLEDDIAERLATLDGKAREMYKETSERWKNLSRKIE